MFWFYYVSVQQNLKKILKAYGPEFKIFSATIQKLFFAKSDTFKMAAVKAISVNQKVMQKALKH